jgi:hypothetical protein
MGPRPSYLSVTAALSRLGAVPILLSSARSISTLEEAIHGSGARFLIADPESAVLGKKLCGEVLVLGGAREERALPSGVTDMELIDPETVELPGWYEPHHAHRGAWKEAARGQDHESAMGIFSLRYGGGGHALSARHRVLLFATSSPCGNVGNRGR